MDQTPVDKVFIDKASGKVTQRPELDLLMSFVRDGDIVVGHYTFTLAEQVTKGKLRSLKQADEADDWPL
ncbi:hypothetical protein [Scandinavium hiltneri]|uniref:hypothetical protein n=1 Tax=Scandinavium hiltneri TaxID=2926519 RepID=UPI004040BA13